MKKARITAILAMMLLALFIIAACSGDEEPAPVATPEPQQDAVATPEPGVEDEPEVASEPEHLGDFTIMTLNWHGANWEDEAQSAMVWEEIERRLLEQRNQTINITPIIVPGGAYMERLQTALAVQEMDAFSLWADIMFGTRPGLVTHLNPYLPEFPDLVNSFSEHHWRSVTYGGNIVAIPSIRFPKGHATFLRYDILQDAGVPIPTTVDELGDALQAFVDAGIEGPLFQEMWMMVMMLRGAFGVPEQNFLDENGNVLNSLFHPGFIEIMDVLNDWHSRGFISGDFEIANYDLSRERFTAGLSGIYQRWALNHRFDYPILLQAIPTADTAVMPPLSHNGGPAVFANDDGTNDPLFITAWAENPSGILAFWDWRLSCIENNLLIQSGLEGHHFRADFENFTLENTPYYADPALTRYTGMWTFQLFYTPAFPIFRWVSDDPIQDRGNYLTWRAAEQQRTATYITSAIGAVPWQHTDAVQNAFGVFNPERDIVMIEYITGRISRDEFISRVEALREIWDNEIMEAMNEVYRSLQ